MSRLSYSQLEFELEQGTGDQQLKRIQAKYGIAAKRQLLNRVSKVFPYYLNLILIQRLQNLKLRMQLANQVQN